MHQMDKRTPSGPATSTAVTGSIRPRNLGVYGHAVSKKSDKDASLTADDIVESNGGKAGAKTFLVFIAATVIILAGSVYIYITRGTYLADEKILNDENARHLRHGNNNSNNKMNLLSDDDDSNGNNNESMNNDDDDDASQTVITANRGGDAESDLDSNADNIGDDDEAASSTELNAKRESIAGSPVNGKSGSKTITVKSYFSDLKNGQVNIDKEGSYKYVLILVEDSNGGKSLMVQGCPSNQAATCKHPDAYKIAKNSLAKYGLKSRILGGGRISRHPSKKSAGIVSIFGYSKTFGACDDCNIKACKLVKQFMPTFTVQFSNEGYKESDEKGIKDWEKC